MKKAYYAITALILIVFWQQVLMLLYIFYVGTFDFISYGIKSKVPLLLHQEVWCGKLFAENDTYEFGSMLNRCYTDVAREKNDENICGKIAVKPDKEELGAFTGKIYVTNNNKERNKCFKLIAEQKQQEGICQSILSQTNADYCRDSVRDAIMQNKN